jgi:PBP1b-binding outer membrane lipoprotein LpoB
MQRKTIILVIIAAVVLGGCVGSAARDAEPNAIQRAKVLSKNEFGITIEHSEWGKPIAFRLADEHCASVKKAAVYRGGVMQIGPDMTSAWRCE